MLYFMLTVVICVIEKMNSTGAETADWNSNIYKSKSNFLNVNQRSGGACVRILFLVP